jgi:hypothetical protein
MIKKITLISLLWVGIAAAEEPTFVSCTFDHLPLMQLIFRGGMGADNNTVQIGDHDPVQLSVGSNMMMATYHGQEYFFWLRLPYNVSIGGIGSDTKTYYGDCISSLRPQGN